VLENYNLELLLLNLHFQIVNILIRLAAGAASAVASTLWKKHGDKIIGNSDSIVIWTY
jgi:hypothetical protein